MESPADLINLVRINVEHRTIEADTWLTGLSPWYRTACAAIIRHWSRMLTLQCTRNDPHEWLDHIRHAATRLTTPTVSTLYARGIIEWRHPRAHAEDEPHTGICWVGDASGGIGGTYLCWVDLFNLSCLGGAHWTRDLSTIRPCGGAAEDIVAHVMHQIALEGT